MKELEQLLVRAEALLARLEPLLPAQVAAPDWQASTAFRWRVSRDGRGRLQSVTHASHISLADLHHVDVQKEQIDQNTRQFVAGKPANNVLLTGARGTGKSSLIVRPPTFPFLYMELSASILLEIFAAVSLT